MTATARKQISMLVPALPPRLDGIGDYSAIVASGLAVHHDVTLIVKDQEPAAAAVKGVATIAKFPSSHPKAILQVRDTIMQKQSQGLLVQYNPFCYGRRGLNPWLPVVLRRIGAAGIRIGVMAHETFVVNGSPAWRVIGRLQRMQLHAIVRTCTVSYTSCDRYRDHVLSVAPGSTVRVMPIGSNIPRIDAQRHSEKARLGIPTSTTVLGMFGTTQSGVQLAFIGEAIRRCREAGHEVVLLYVGSQGGRLRDHMPANGLMDLGRLEPTDVSRALTAMDIYLATFDDGISTRRGTVMAALQHGAALVGTIGKNTDALWRTEDGTSLVLAAADNAGAFSSAVLSLVTDGRRAATMGACGTALYHRMFDWPHTVTATTSFME